MDGNPSVIVRPAPMHADLRRGEEGDGAKVFAVADTAPADKPKLIQLPAIDKAALAQAAAAQEAAARASQDAGAQGNCASKPATAAVPKQVSGAKSEAPGTRKP
jgi:hypothetical protein